MLNSDQKAETNKKNKLYITETNKFFISSTVRRCPAQLALPPETSDTIYANIHTLIELYVLSKTSLNKKTFNLMFRVILIFNKRILTAQGQKTLHKLNNNMSIATP
jgi:hypothetical protein